MRTPRLQPYVRCVLFAVAAACLLPGPLAFGKSDPVPPEQLVGKWKDAKDVIVMIGQNDKGEFTLTRNDVGWEQLIPYRPGGSLIFKYKPSPEQMPDDIPGEIQDKALAAGLEWRIRFTDIQTGYRVLGHGCKLFMKGEFLPGDVKWRKVTDKDTGEVTNVFESAKVGGPPKPIELKQVTYYLPDMGQWLTIQTNLDSTFKDVGLAQIANTPMEAQAYTYLGNLDASILEGMYNGLTLMVPLEGVGKYGIKLLKGLAKGKLEGKSTNQAALDTLGKMFAGEILKGLLPKGQVPESMKSIADKVIDKVAEKVGKPVTAPLNEALFSGDEANRFKSYLTDVCRFQFIQLPNYNPQYVSTAMVVVDTKLGTAHFIFVAPPHNLNTGGRFQGGILSGDINLPEDGEKPKPTRLDLHLDLIPQE
jgi:hypothetical protein